MIESAENVRESELITFLVPVVGLVLKECWFSESFHHTYIPLVQKFTRAYTTTLAWYLPHFIHKPRWCGTSHLKNCVEFDKSVGDEAFLMSKRRSNKENETNISRAVRASVNMGQKIELQLFESVCVAHENRLRIGCCYCFWCCNNKNNNKNNENNVREGPQVYFHPTSRSEVGWKYTTNCTTFSFNRKLIKFV